MNPNIFEDVEARYKKCELKIVGLKTKQDTVARSIERLQKILAGKKNEKVKIDKDIFDLEQEKDFLDVKRLAIALKSKNVNIKDLDVNKTADTISLKKDDLLKEAEENPIETNNSLTNETSIEDTDSEVIVDEIVHSREAVYGDRDSESSSQEK